MNSRILYLSSIFTAAFLFPATAADDLHLKAAYAIADTKVKDITAFYREIEVIQLQPNTYSAIPFNGGYVGLAGPKRPHINFSIWDTKENGEVIGEAELIEASRRGRPDNHRFGHEGSGFHSELDYEWKEGERYKVYVSVTHDESEATTFSAWFGKADEEDWQLIARIKRPGIHYLGRPGGFLEHPGKKNADLLRTTAFGGGWVSDGRRWTPVESIKFSCKDSAAANAFVREDMVAIQIGLETTSDFGDEHVFEVTPVRSRPPVLPE